MLEENTYINLGDCQKLIDEDFQRLDDLEDYNYDLVRDKRLKKEHGAKHLNFISSHAINFCGLLVNEQKQFLSLQDAWIKWGIPEEQQNEWFNQFFEGDFVDVAGHGKSKT